MKRRVQLKVYIDEDILDSLWALIKKKHGRIYGALSAEVQDAIAHWIRENQVTLDLHTGTHKIVNPSIPTSHLHARRIIERLRSMGFTLQCRDTDLAHAIEEVRGSDPRTIRKWTKFLVDHGYMKWITHRILEIV